jgi:hypothetical protein
MKKASRDVSEIVLRKIDQYKPSGNLDHTARLFLALYNFQPLTKGHVERVALLGEATAVVFEKDAKAAFFAGLLHDVGKIIFGSELFSGFDISRDEYEKVKSHAVNGFLALSEFHLFVALCAGLHHNLYKFGYGINLEDFSSEISPATAKKILEISGIISICDFVDAFVHRQTKIQDSSDAATQDLEGMLREKYPEDHILIGIILKVNKKLGL